MLQVRTGTAKQIINIKEKKGHTQARREPCVPRRVKTPRHSLPGPLIQESHRPQCHRGRLTEAAPVCRSLCPCCPSPGVYLGLLSGLLGLDGHCCPPLPEVSCANAASPPGVLSHILVVALDSETPPPRCAKVELKLQGSCRMRKPGRKRATRDLCD